MAGGAGIEGQRQAGVTTPARVWLHAGKVVLPDPHGDDRYGHRVVEATVECVGRDIAAVVEEDAASALRRATASASSPAGAASLRDFGADALLSPAFVDAHVHVPMLYFRGLGSAFANRGNLVEDLFYAVESRLQPGDVRAFARMGAYELLRAGTATVWDHYYSGVEVAHGLRDAGITGVVAPTLQDVAGPGVTQLEAQWDATFAIDADATLCDADLFAALGPHATDTVSPALWTRVAEAARAQGWPVHAHLAQSVEEWLRARELANTSPVGILDQAGVLDAAPRLLLVHGIFLDDADLRRLRRAPVTLGFCPFSQLQFGFPADVMRWAGAGLPFYVATDCAACNDGTDVQKELRLLAGLRTAFVGSGAEAAAFAETGRRNAALALDARRKACFDAVPGWDAPSSLLSRVWDIPGDLDPRLPVGQIAVGRRAHVAVWDASAPQFWPAIAPLRGLALGSPLPALRGLYVSGRPVGGDAEADGFGLRSLVDGPEVREARQEAKARFDALLERLRLPAMS